MPYRFDRVEPDTRTVKGVCAEIRDVWKILNYARNWGMRKPDYPPADVARLVPRPEYQIILVTDDLGRVKGRHIPYPANAVRQ